MSRDDLTPEERLALHELRQGNGLYYIAQELAFAPGIAGEWPDIVKHPKSKHGRLVKRVWPVNERKDDPLVTLPRPERPASHEQETA